VSITKQNNDNFFNVTCKILIFSYRCELCPEAFFRNDHRVKHFAIAHSNSYKCNECDLQFDRAYKYDAHNVQHGIPVKSLKVEDGKDKYDLRLNDIKFIENTRNYDYTTDDALLHQESRATSNLNTLNSEPLMTKDEFCEKYIGFVSDKLLNCVACQQEIQKGSLISHLTWKHAVKKPLKCPFCNERVVKTQARLIHMAKCHPDDYKCADCNLQVAKHSLLVDHVKECHNKKLLTKPSSFEEEDFHTCDLRFVANKNEDEIIEDEEHAYLDLSNVEKKVIIEILYCFVILNFKNLHFRFTVQCVRKLLHHQKIYLSTSHTNIAMM
jgi:DNA-directed RNA polymerase subunit RPC12/RpoP